MATTSLPDRAHVVIIACSIERMRQLIGHLDRESVELVRAIEGERQNPVGDFVLQRGVVHGLGRIRMGARS